MNSQTFAALLDKIRETSEVTMKIILILLLLPLIGCGSKGAGSSPASATSSVGIFDGNFTLKATTCTTAMPQTMTSQNDVLTFAVNSNIPNCNYTASTGLTASGLVAYTKLNCDMSAACAAAQITANQPCNGAEQTPQETGSTQTTTTISNGVLTINNVASSCVSTYSQE